MNFEYLLERLFESAGCFLDSMIGGYDAEIIEPDDKIVGERPTPLLMDKIVGERPTPLLMEIIIDSGDNTMTVD